MIALDRVSKITVGKVGVVIRGLSSSSFRDLRRLDQLYQHIGGKIHAKK